MFELQLGTQLPTGRPPFKRESRVEGVECARLLSVSMMMFKYTHGHIRH